MGQPEERDARAAMPHDERLARDPSYRAHLALRAMRAVVSPAATERTTPDPAGDAVMLLMDFYSHAMIALHGDVSGQIHFTDSLLERATAALVGLEDRFPTALASARLVEAARIASVNLHHAALERSSPDEITKIAEGSALNIRRAALGGNMGPNPPSEVIGRNEVSKIAPLVRDELAQLLLVLRNPGPTHIAQYLEVAIHLRGADRIFPGMHSRRDLRKLWEPTIAKALKDVNDSEDPEQRERRAKAKTIICRIAKLYGMKRPAQTLFDRERKASERREVAAIMSRENQR